MIFEFDIEENLNILKENIRKIESLNDSLSDFPTKYREFYRELNLDFSEAKEVIKKSEFALLIECYTFSERLLKNTIYHCLEYDKSNNKHINAFMKKKIKPDNFSPNVMFNNFEDELRSLENSNKYKFLIKKNNIRVKIYDEMIKSRHRYAHSNEYPMNYNDYKEIVLVLEYLSWECNLFVYHLDKRIEMLAEYNIILEEIKKLAKLASSTQKLRGQQTDRTLGIELKDFRKKIINYLKKYKNELDKVAMLQDEVEILQKIATLNFTTNTVNDLKNLCKDYLKER
ncbi:hypothetical protein [Enterococcus mundtii]|uniref:hypothetical protein n=1 Tax=Enterococcus mundtii TaxID=53346 RepID=UPI0018978074|nr:hypothetical protein [Enterococcus mundtii]MDB7100127.1 hypothetical protein [Enterococcus mundtii]